MPPFQQLMRRRFGQTVVGVEPALALQDCLELVGTRRIRAQAGGEGVQRAVRHIGGICASLADVVDQLLSPDVELVGEQQQARRVRRHQQPHVGGRSVEEREVVLGLDLLHLRELVRQRVETLDRPRLLARDVAGDGAKGDAAVGTPLVVARRGDEDLPLERVAEVGEDPVQVDVDAVAVLVQVGRRHRDVLRPARRAARGREHQRVLGGEHVLLAREHAVDVRRQRFVRVHRNGRPVVLDRLDRAEAVLPSEGRVLVAADDLEQLLLLRLPRRPGGVVELVRVAELQPGPEQALKGRCPAHVTPTPETSTTRATVPISSTNSSRTRTPRPRPPKTRARPRRPGSTRSSVRSRFSSRLPPEPSR